MLTSTGVVRVEEVGVISERAMGVARKIGWTVAAAVASILAPLDQARAQQEPDCYANCDASSAAPALNAGDFACFLARFRAGDPWANCDQSTTPPTLNAGDFVCFLSAFVQGCPSSPPVANAYKPREFLRRAATQRIAIVRLGDSNQVYGGHGFDHGFQKALADRWGVYATPILSVNENQGMGSAIGYRCSAITEGSIVGEPVTPSTFYADLLRFVGDGCTVHELSYISGTVSGGVGLGVAIEADWPGNISGRLRYSLWNGRFPASTGSFRPGWRKYDAPDILLMSPVVRTGPSAPSVVRTDLDLPAAPRDYRLRASPNLGGQGDYVGPWLGTYQSVSNLDMLRGGAQHSLFTAGGRGLWHYAGALQQTPDATLQHFFRAVGDLISQTGQPRRVVIMVDSGLNDRTTPQPSLGPVPAPSDTGPGYTDNARAIIDRLRSVLLADGWSDDELCFVFSTSHPTDVDPLSFGEAPLNEFRAAMRAMALRDRDVSFVNVAELITAAEMLALNYYNWGGFDRAHLTQAAYEDISARILAALVR